MKKIITIILLVVLTACNTRTEETIDGCEYINSQSWNGHGYTEVLTHKGNCKNPIHQQNKADTTKITPPVYEPISSQIK